MYLVEGGGGGGREGPGGGVSLDGRTGLLLHTEQSRLSRNLSRELRRIRHIW